MYLAKKFSVVLFFICFYYLGKTQTTDLIKVPGVVITHSPAETKTYLGTPSICIMPNGKYLCSHNTFGQQGNKTFVYQSSDNGDNWEKIAEFQGVQYTLFFHDSVLYAMGVDVNLGNCVIRKSLDEGVTWTRPDSETTGLIRTGDFEKGYHSSAVSVLIANGRIWHPYELDRKKGWGNFEALMLSAPIDSDLLDAENWTTSNRLSVDTAWGNNYRAWLEGGAVLSPTGEILDFLRVDKREDEYAAIIHVSDDGKHLSFNPDAGFIRFPGGCKKFVVRYDSISSRYISFSNWIPEKFKGYNVERTRNTLAMVSSKDLRNWEVNKIILQDDNVNKSGFQYADWQIEGNDIVLVSRTSFFDGKHFADSQHNSNYITFHRIKNFRYNLELVLEVFNNQ